MSACTSGTESDVELPVRFTPKSPLDAASGGLVFYDFVDPDVASQSSVLSCIAESEGEAILPEAVTLSDFRLWLTATSWPEFGEQRKNIPLCDICKVLQVADVLDDTDLDDWVQLAADHLIKQLPGSQNWKHRHQDKWTQDSIRLYVPRDIEASIDDLASLPNHVQSLVYAALVERQPSFEDSIGSYLYLFLDEVNEYSVRPLKVCSTVLAAAIPPAKKLRIHPDVVPDHFFNALRELPAAPPALLSLDITAADHTRTSMCSQQTAQHLANALRHHSGLSSLTLGPPCHSPEVFEVLAPAMTALRSLQSLHLGTAKARIAEASMPLLHGMLRSMPNLVHLQIFLHISSAKRQRDADAPAPQQHCLARALSPATTLTSLHINAFTDSQTLPASSALKLPQLQDLRLDVSRSLHAAALLRRLEAPLSALSIGLALPALAPEDAADTQGFVEALARFQQLRQLAVVNRKDRRRDMRSDVWVARALSLMLTATSAPLMVLQKLHILDVENIHLSTLRAAAPRLQSIAPALQRLKMTVRGLPSETGTAPQWAAICGHLSLLQLQHLSLSLVHGEGLRLLDLQRITSLSALSLWGDYYSEGHKADELCALARVSQLRCLHLDIGRLKEQPLAKLVSALAALPNLATLVLAGLWPAGLAQAMSACPAGAWPVLRRLGVEVYLAAYHEERELVRTLSGMPGLQTLALRVFDGDRRNDDDQEDDALREELGEMDHIEELRVIAKHAGVKVEDVDDWAAECLD